MSFTPGLVSVTFRHLSAQSVVELAARCGLRAMEWGGDVHVPHGDTATARAVRRMTLDRGLTCEAYGSYFRAGSTRPDAPSITEVVDTAAALGARSVRVWAGERGSGEADAGYRSMVVDSLAAFADGAREADLEVTLEFHAGTLTDSPESALAVLDEIDRPNVRTGWQPPVPLDVPARLETLRRVLDRVSTVHVFHWPTTSGEVVRRPLAEGAGEWRRYLQLLRSGEREHALLLEFVPKDDPGELSSSAEVLRTLIEGCG
ncbi:MAG: TIM barrel protein [Planctomycetota bacterium]